MERALSAEERIKRAEEIYYRRRMQNTGVRVTANSSNNETKTNYKLLKKMILQILICIMIYIIFYLVQNTNYIFSEDFINKTKEILSYDINFQKIYGEIHSKVNIWIENNKHENQEQTDENQTNNENVENNVNSNNEGNNSETAEDIQNTSNPDENKNPITEENIGGAVELENKEGLSQMEIDANYIKEKYSISKPISGTITSRYGIRNPTTTSVPKNHTGIDIAAKTGTVIYAALDGIVKISSSEGDYGKHLRIEKDDIAIYYAHCSKLYVRKGDTVKKGDAIAEVGATGNVTGPHLHFEIRREERYINPDLILEF